MSLLKEKIRNRVLRMGKGRSLSHPLALANLAALDRLDEAAPARGHEFVVVDLETTGLDPAVDRVVSVGAVRISRGRVRLADIFAELVNPGRDIPAESVKIHGITPQMIQEARHGALVIEDFVKYLGDSIMVAHYAGFDLHFINMVMRERLGLTLQNLVLDTVRMCRSVLLPSDPYGIKRNKKRCSLDSLAERFGIDVAGRHTAMGDAITTAMIFQRMLKRLEQVGPGRLKDLVRVAKL